jgi:hypothetical protein
MPTATNPDQAMQVVAAALLRAEPPTGDPYRQHIQQRTMNRRARIAVEALLRAGVRLPSDDDTRANLDARTIPATAALRARTLNVPVLARCGQPRSGPDSKVKCGAERGHEPANLHVGHSADGRCWSWQS